MKVHKGDFENFDEEELHPEIEINLDRMNEASNRKGLAVLHVSVSHVKDVQVLNVLTL